MHRLSHITLSCGAACAGGKEPAEAKKKRGPQASNAITKEALLAFSGKPQTVCFPLCKVALPLPACKILGALVALQSFLRALCCLPSAKT